VADGDEVLFFEAMMLEQETHDRQIVRGKIMWTLASAWRE